MKKLFTRGEAGMSTSEYAVGTLGACTVALVLHQLATDGYFLDHLMETIRRALAWGPLFDGVPRHPLGL